LFLLVAHFLLEDYTAPAGAATPFTDGDAGAVTDQDAIPPSAAEPLAMLAASPECLRLRFARSTDVAGRFVLIAEFASAAQYRRSLSPWPMRTVVVPWLSTAQVDVSEVHEVLLAAEQGRLTATEPTVTPPGR
jgi:hypothetical protein